MPQGVLPFQYHSETAGSNLTAYAGLGIYLDLAHTLGLGRAIDREVGLRRDGQGYTDRQQVMALMWLNVCGGQGISDLDVLEADEGLMKLMKHVEWTGGSKAERKELAARWRTESRRVLPSQSACGAYLQLFHDEEQETLREAGKAFIPRPTAALQGLDRVNARMAAFYYRHCDPHPTTATLDLDATIIETTKQAALPSYKTGPSYQPLSVYLAEAGLVVRSEFRDGNVPAGYENLRILEESLDLLPPEGRQVYLRADTASYQWELLRYCAEGKHPRFGVIEFCIGADVTPELKTAIGQVPEPEWQPVHKTVEGQTWETGQEWAEVAYVPNAAATKKNGPDYRFIAIRERLTEQLTLPGMTSPQLELPFPTLSMATVQGCRWYKVHALVTNRTLPGETLIQWSRERCGKGEEIHGVMKTDFAGGRLPSNKFGVNAAWWAIVVLAVNLSTLVKRLVLGGVWITRRMKAIRFGLIGLSGRVVEQARRLVIKVSGQSPSYSLLLAARGRIAQFAAGASGWG